jgi:DNA-binding MarR family transcriptional regulator
MSRKSSAKTASPRLTVTTLSVDTKRKVIVSGGLDEGGDQEWRHNTFGRLLLFAFHAFEARLLEGYHAAGFSDVRQVHLNVLRHLDLTGGTRIIDLAARAGVTKGAMGKLVEDCARLGLVTLESDPADRRAKIVSYSKRGREFVAVTRRAARRIETDFAKLLGPERFAMLRGDLIALRERIVKRAIDRVTLARPPRS